MLTSAGGDPPSGALAGADAADEQPVRGGERLPGPGDAAAPAGGAPLPPPHAAAGVL